MPAPWIDYGVVKEQADFARILSGYGITLKGQGSQHLVVCPFHKEKVGSLSVNLNLKVFHCFGCGAKGDVLDFVATIENVTIREAAEIIAESCRIPTNGDKPSRAEAGKPVERQQAVVGGHNPSGSARGVASDTLSGSEEGNTLQTSILSLDSKHPYFAERGLTPELVETFGLGYCSHGFLRERVCIPIHSPEGELVAYAGRWASDDVPPRVPKYLLPRGFKKSEVLFNLHRVASAEHVMLVEGYWAVFRLHALGIPAVALMGRTLSGAQEELLACSGARFVTLLLDGDEAGRTAAQALLPRITRNWFVYHAELPDGQQPDTVDEEELRRLLWTLLRQR